jgi:hypothetical protein
LLFIVPLIICLNASISICTSLDILVFPIPFINMAKMSLSQNQCVHSIPIIPFPNHSFTLRGLFLILILRYCLLYQFYLNILPFAICCYIWHKSYIFINEKIIGKLCNPFIRFDLLWDLEQKFGGND